MTKILVSEESNKSVLQNLSQANSKPTKGFTYTYFILKLVPFKHGNGLYSLFENNITLCCICHLIINSCWIKSESKTININLLETLYTLLKANPNKSFDKGHFKFKVSPRLPTISPFYHNYRVSKLFTCCFVWVQTR